MKRLHRKIKTKRIYIGPPGHETEQYWTVRVTDAKTPVTIRGGLMHALLSHAGSTVCCSLSNAAIDPTNRKQFPHPVLYAVFLRTIALMVTKIGKDGQPSHATRYVHKYAKLVDLNDKGQIKPLAKEDPSIMERDFTLSAPRIGRPRGKTDGASGSATTTRAFVNRGALRRARDAGLISPAIAKHMVDAAKPAA